METYIEESAVYPMIHVFMPALIYAYVDNPWIFFTIVYAFESLEYILSLFFDERSENKFDSLVGDIINAMIGAAIITVLAPRVPAFRQKLLHVALLVITAIIVVYVSDQLGFFIYGAVYTALAWYFTDRKWTVFSAVSFLLVYTIASDVFTAEPSHVPLATLIVLPLSLFAHMLKPATPRTKYLQSLRV